MADSKKSARESNLPSGVQCSTFWIDESGSKSTASKCFVVAGIKTRHPDDLLRDIHSIRERSSFDKEFKFGRLTTRSLPVFAELVDVLEGSDAHIAATVVDERHNPFKGKEHWLAQAAIITQLVIGNINRNELATVLMDGISTPQGKSLGAAVKRGVNGRLRATVVTTAISLDSRSNDLLQAADLVAGSIFFQRMAQHRVGAPNVQKLRIANRLAAAFGVADLNDQRTKRANIKTLVGPRRTEPMLRVVSRRQSAS